MSSLVLVMALAAQLNATAVSPFDIVTRANRAAERDSVALLERQWSRVRASEQGHRPALLGLATLARLTFRFARAESLYLRVIETRNTADAFSVVARQGFAGLLANGRSPALADSSYVLALEEARRIGLERAEAEILVNLASVRTRTSGTRGALELIAESRRVLPQLPPREEAQRSCIEGSFGSRLGDPVVERRLAAGRELARRSREWRAFAECSLLAAQISEHRGYFGRALLELDTAVMFMRRTRAYSSLAIALQWGAFVRYQTGSYGQARRDYIESVEFARRARNVAVEAWALTGLAQIAIVLGDLSGGRELLRAATVLHQERNDRWGYATVRELEGALHDALGDDEAARKALNEAVTVQTQLGQQLLAVAPLRLLSRIELSAGRVDAAERALQRATQYAVASRDEGWGRELEFHLAGIAIARGKYEQADSLLRVIATRIATNPVNLSEVEYNFAIRYAGLSARRGDWRNAERWLERAVMTLEAWRSALFDKEARLRLAQARTSWGTIGVEYPGLIAGLAAEGRITSAFALSEAVRARELTTAAVRRANMNPDAGRMTHAISAVSSTGKATTLKQLQASLDGATAALVYVAGQGRSATTLFIITRSAATSRLLTPTDSIAPSLERYLRLAADGEVAAPLAKRLGELLLADAVNELPPGVTRLLIVPERALYRVPFDALRLADGRYAVERFTISIAPSAAFIVSASRIKGGVAAGGLLAFGDAANETVPLQLVTNRGGNGERAASLPRLRYSGDEARRVARYATGSRVLVRGAATEQALRRADLSAVRILHFATHAVMDDRSLPRNMLVLSPSAGNDGFVGPDELSALSLRDALVVLSGCSTVGGIVLGGEGLRGLTAPLLEAGARAVVATHWAIGDQSTLPFVDRFYSHMAAGMNVGAALRRAKLDAIRDSITPAVWAAFSLVGDGAMKVQLRPVSTAPLPWVRSN